MLQLNLFHEQQQIQREKDFDPVRLTILGGIVAIALIVFWAMIIYANMGDLREGLGANEAKKKTLDKEFKELGAPTDFPGIQSQAISIQKRIQNRPLFATHLDVFRDLIPTNCQVRVLKTVRSLEFTEEKSKNKKGVESVVKKSQPSLNLVFEITTKGRDKGEVLQVRDSFLETLQKSTRLRSLLKQAPTEEDMKSTTHEPKAGERAIGIFEFKLAVALKDEPRIEK